MSRRYKSRTMKFGVPLSVPGSRYVEHCYAAHGKGYARTPPRNSAIELILVNAQRQLWRVDGYFLEPHKYLTDATTHDSGWRILGWRMADESMPLGEYEAVDPELAQFDYLPVPNAQEVGDYCIPPNASGVGRRDSRDPTSAFHGAEAGRDGGITLKISLFTGIWPGEGLSRTSAHRHRPVLSEAETR